MKILRTPEERFADLPDFDFEPKYVELDGLRIHYVEHGTGSPILCLHGEPSWSFLYRKMLPILGQQHRAIAFDFAGFGRSDKPAKKSDYSYELHYNTLKKFVEKLDLKDITLVVQDWGGLIGLPYATDHPQRISRLVIMNTMLPSGRQKSALKLVFRAFPFFAWQLFSRLHPSLPIGKIIDMGTVQQLPDAVKAAYNAPFPDRTYKAGAAVWPSLVPVTANKSGAPYMQRTRKLLKEWQKPALVLFSDKDPITGSHAGYFRRTIPTAAQQPDLTIRNAGHFLQEDKGEEIAGHILRFFWEG